MKNFTSHLIKLLFSFIVLLFHINASGQCNYVFTDQGGINGNYPSNSNLTTTFCPDVAGMSVAVTFSEFNLTDFSCFMYNFCNDYLQVYNGNNINSPLIGTYSGNTIPGPFISTSSDGCLTFRFISDSVDENSGWIANVCNVEVSGFKLNSFIDSNNNGVMDNGEINYNQGYYSYQKNNGATKYLYNNGYNSLIEENPANIYNFNYHLYANNYDLFTFFGSGYSNQSIISYPNLVNLDFPITSIGNGNDLKINLVNIGLPNAGFNYKTRILYTNNCTNAIDGTINFTNDSANTIVSTTQPVINTATGFTFDFSNLQPFETRFLDVTLNVPSIPTVSIGQLLTNSATISTLVTENNYNNNSSSVTAEIVASYDPNDITESHGEQILYSTFEPNDYLYYTIRFENTGTAPANNIQITNVLDNAIDENSIEMVASSHSYVLNREANNLTWRFDNIGLLVSEPNSNRGKGFITYKVKPIPGFSIGTTISNLANIYFDTNPAITTNTFVTEFVSALSNSNFENNKFIISPNPTKNTFNIQIKNSEKIISVTIYNILGQLVQNNVENKNKIDISNLKPGNYIVKVQSDFGIYNAKLIKE